MKTTRYILFALLMLLLVLPAVQQYSGFIPEKPLNGAITIPTKPALSWKSWFDASFQEQYDDFLEQGIGFRPTLIRINNQIAFTLFDTALANGVIIGKNNYLYEINYIKAFEGTDLVSADSIQHQVEKARFLQDEMSKMGKHFLIVLAPGKGTYYPEFIPEKYRNPNKKLTNYQIYSTKLKESGINFIDFNNWFVKMKDTTSYPLYSKTGIHWSVYGVSLAVDSLLKYMEKASGKDMVDFGWDGLEFSNYPKETDNDIADGMNILFPIRTERMAYPRNRFTDQPDKYRPNVIAVGDSYYWNIMGSGISARLFAENNFWYYNKEAFNPSWEGAKQVSSLNIIDEINRQDFVILLCTDANLPKFAFGFLDDYYKATHKSITAPPLDKEREKRILEIMTAIRDSKDWADQIRVKAKNKGIGFEEMLRLDAEWVYEQQKSK
ncbi:MAG: hypothetical protein IPH88_14345 [Bacteroidales bacterium]|nr:hypothetical protein [Bacteroidales bacterium]